jgi:hypothetical protein
MHVTCPKRFNGRKRACKRLYAGKVERSSTKAAQRARARSAGDGFGAWQESDLGQAGT